jgi:RNA polymerase sigma-70 factor (ECF subfamily)
MTAADRFATTEWSRVCAARDGADTRARLALGALCRTYWVPLYAFVRSRGYDPESAADLTQEYFTELMEKDVLRSVDPSAGRFRSFLLSTLKHFLSRERDRKRTLKRGGGTSIVSLDVTDAETRFRGLAADGRSPEQVFERQWALAVLERALNRLRESARASGSLTRFEHLKGTLTGDLSGTTYREVADQLGMTDGAVRGAVHRLRKRFGAILREEVAATIADPEDVDDEIRHMLSVIRPWTSS